jgi:hypothetical protein
MELGIDLSTATQRFFFFFFKYLQKRPIYVWVHQGKQQISCLFQRAPGTGELVVFGVDAMKPFMELGVVSGIFSFSIQLTNQKTKKCLLKSRTIFTCVTINLRTLLSADGKRLVHKVDLKFDRCTLSHDMGVTERLVIFAITGN